MTALGLALCLLGAAAMAWGLHTRRRTRATMLALDAMLDAATAGAYLEKTFDESQFSALEAKMARYLRASAVSARNLTAERDKITQLISDISHQTKTPVANLLLYAQLLGEQPLSPEGAACAEALTAQAEKLRFLIDALLKASRLETGILTLRPQRQAVLPLLREVTAQLLPKAAAKQVALACTGGDEMACFDAKWTAEALHNLVDNALKYTPSGGSVALSCQRYELFLRIDVRDTGVGICEAEQAKIFGRFYRGQAAATQEGVGLGLYLAREIAQAQGGYLKAGATPGGGATFSLFLSTDPQPAASQFFQNC